MKEIHDIIETFERLGENEKAALATVVKVDGSSYRQPGARMLITGDGRLTGAISGGCLEGDALRKALLVIARKKPMLVTYDTTVDDDSGLGIGLGCNGIIHILIEPVNRSNPDNPIILLKKITDNRQTAVLVTLFSMDQKYDPLAGTHLAYTDRGLLGSAPVQVSVEHMVAAAADALQNRQSLLREFTREDGETQFVFACLVRPVVSLIIVGAGNDVQPLVKIASLLGWKITVIDGRPSYATCQRFPDASDVFVAGAEDALQNITVDSLTAAVLMTHNFYYDKVMLKHLLEEEAFYIGVLGPKKKLQRMLQELPEIKIHGTNRLNSIYGPVGLDIGAETAEEIAVSVIAEIKAVLSGRNGTSLHDKKAPIHKWQPEEGIPATDPMLVIQSYADPLK